MTDNRQIVKGNTGDWKVTIGLEVHAQVNTNTKLFSRSPTEFGAEPNTQVSLVDAALPGMLPTLNQGAITAAIKTGLGIEGDVRLKSIFDRKNYFYADLPQGYQISQYSDPIVENGKVIILQEDGSEKVVRIERIHLEQDAGKSLHDQSPSESYIDLNRSGVPLMEIVTRPDISSSFEAGEFVKKLRSVLRYLETSDGDMEKGSLRCDANVSVNRIDDDKLGTRTEIKNLNSVKNIIKAINYEADRQVEALENGEEVVQETRLFDVSTMTTRTMRSKEDAQDYRYFPDPDLLPVLLEQNDIDSVKKSMPELPDQKIHRYMKEFKLSEYDASVLTAEKEVAEFFESTISNKCDGKLAANWIVGEFFGKLNKENMELSESKISPSMLAELVKLISDNVISGKIAKEVFEIMFDTGSNPADIIEEKGMKQVSNEDEISALITSVLDANQDKVEEYRNGKDKLFGFFVGQVMKVSKGKANPGVVNQLLKNALSG